MKHETKFVGVTPEVVSVDGTIKGYASLFGLRDQGGDIVQPGAFSASLQSGRGVAMLWQHDPTRPIGIWTKVVEDEKGLYVEGELFLETQAGKEAHILLKRGGIKGLSIGYKTRRSKKTADGRLLYEVDLFEISLVTFPMLAEASVSDVKSYEDGNYALLKREVEQLVRDAGFSASEAKAAAAGAASALSGERDAAEPSAADVTALIRQIATSE